MPITLNGTTGIGTPQINAGNLVGQVCFFAMASAPSGFLVCDGSAVSRTTYAELFAAIGTLYGAGNGTSTFNLPDLRGEFIRGVDGGRGVDPSRSLGSAQGDAIRNATGTFAYRTAEGAYSGPFAQGSQIWSDRSGVTGISSAVYGVSFDLSRSVPTADENRPRNVALLPCIKF